MTPSCFSLLAAVNETDGFIIRGENRWESKLSSQNLNPLRRIGLCQHPDEPLLAKIVLQSAAGTCRILKKTHPKWCKAWAGVHVRWTVAIGPLSRPKINTSAAKRGVWCSKVQRNVKNRQVTNNRRSLASSEIGLVIKINVITEQHTSKAT